MKIIAKVHQLHEYRLHLWRVGSLGTFYINFYSQSPPQNHLTEMNFKFCIIGHAWSYNIHMIKLKLRVLSALWRALLASTISLGHKDSEIVAYKM